MFLTIHIILAIISIIQIVFAFFYPSKIKLQIGNLLTVSTIISGFLLSLFGTISIRQVCIRGAIYLGLIVTMSVLAQKRIIIGGHKSFDKLG